MNNKLDNIIAFFSGDIFATVLFMYSSLNSLDWLHPLLKMGLALVVGVFGGAGGLLGKDIYEGIKRRFKKRFNK